MTSFFLYCAAILPSWLAVLGTVIIVGDLALFPYPIPKNDLKKLGEASGYSSKVHFKALI